MQLRFWMLLITRQRVENRVVAVVVLPAIEVDLRQAFAELGAVGIQPDSLFGFGECLVRAESTPQHVAQFEMPVRNVSALGDRRAQQRLRGGYRLAGSGKAPSVDVTR